MARWPFGTILEWEAQGSADTEQGPAQGASVARYFFGLAEKAGQGRKNASGPSLPLSLTCAKGRALRNPFPQGQSRGTGTSPCKLSFLS